MTGVALSSVEPVKYEGNSSATKNEGLEKGKGKMSWADFVEQDSSRIRKS